MILIMEQSLKERTHNMETTNEKRATFTPGPWQYTLADETSSGGVYGNEKCVYGIYPRNCK